MDHAKEAERLLSAHPVGQAADGSWATAISAEAQVHATLALAEQARIANLLALAHDAYSWPNKGRAQDVLASPAIAHTLGLDSEGDE